MASWRTIQLCALLLVGFAVATPRAGAVLLLDSGTPSEVSNLLVFYWDFPITAGQWFAQPFTLVNDANITSIEAYIGGRGAPILMTLARAIGPMASPDDALGAYLLALPGTDPNEGAFVAAPVALSLAAGTYYLVFSSTGPVSIFEPAADFVPASAPGPLGPLGPGGFMPTAAPNPLGPVGISFMFHINRPDPHLSNFFQILGDQYALGIRVYGDPAIHPVIPEPLSMLLIGTGVPAAFALRRRLA